MKLNLLSGPRQLIAVVAILIGLGTAAAAQTVATAPQDDRYRIGPGDVLDIRILNRPQLSRDAVRVEGNGMIRMPLIDSEIRATCRSEGELAKEIAQGYLKFYRNPQVDVFIKEYHARQVAVMGAVIEPARFEMKQRYRLLDLLSYAKGPSDKAGQIVNIVRGPKMSVCEGQAADVDDGDALLSVRLSDTMSGLERANPYVRAGDIITIPEADQVYVVGNVYTPKTLPLKEPMTVSRAIAMAGGPLQDSKTSRIKVLRQEPGTGAKTELYVDLGAVAKKRAEDLMLRPNDIIEVPTSTGKSLLRSLLGSVAPSIAQLPVRVIP
ncbi:MAG: polysaccharide biosynthesis/export protein [Blastocatellia bacterium]|jgi:polysaccharide export outer membrane protein|nr:polysaccharide biosynthesis/export protein [Blastocatellia bacterium]